MNYWMIGPNLVAAILYSKGEILFTLLIFSCCPKSSMVWKRRALSLREFQVQTPYSNFHSETFQSINHRNHWSNNCVIHQTQTLGTPEIFTIIIAWTSSSTFSKSLRHTQHCGVNNKKKTFNYTRIFRKQPAAASIWLTFGEDEALAGPLAWPSYQSHQQLTYRTPGWLFWFRQRRNFRPSPPLSQGVYSVIRPHVQQVLMSDRIIAQFHLLSISCG